MVGVGWKQQTLVAGRFRMCVMDVNDRFYALPKELQDMIWAQREFDDAVESDDIPTIVKFVESGTDKQKADGAEAIWSLVGIRNINNKRLVREAGGIGPLIALVRSGTDVQKMWATSALMNLSAFNEENSNAIREAEGIEPLIALVRSGTEDQKDDAIGVLNNLSSSCDNQIAIKMDAPVFLNDTEATGVDGYVGCQLLRLLDLLVEDSTLHAVRNGAEPRFDELIAATRPGWCAAGAAPM